MAKNGYNIFGVYQINIKFSFFFEVGIVERVRGDSVFQIKFFGISLNQYTLLYPWDEE